jgi:hypothetical protein
MAAAPATPLRRWLPRAALAWLLIAAVETLHGIARTLWLAPIIGDPRARQWAIVTGLLLILLAALLTVRWIGVRTVRALLAVGTLWAVLMLSFDVALARWVFGYSWTRIAADFDPLQGGFLGIGMASMVGAPWLAARLRGIV